MPWGCAHRAIELFWESGVDSIRSFWELTELTRCDDKWYNAFLQQCRVGNLSLQDYNYFHGLPTFTSPGSGKCGCNSDVVNDPILGPYRKTWKDRFLAGQLPEGKFTECRGKRTDRRRRLKLQRTGLHGQ